MIYNKVFFLRKGKGAVSARKVIQAVEQCILERNIQEEVLVHTDNGTKFGNVPYYLFKANTPTLNR